MVKRRTEAANLVKNPKAKKIAMKNSDPMADIKLSFGPIERGSGKESIREE